ncbi:MAG: alpha/beta fold hydrolase [Acidobacteriota bacterium]
MLHDDVPSLPEPIARRFPFRRRRYVVQDGAYSGRSICFVDDGDPGGRPVVLVHGNPTWSFLWRKVIRCLSGLRILAPDLLGLGCSDKLPKLGDHTVQDHGDALAEWIRALDLRGMILVGQDWGGPMVTGIGAREPERVAGLVAANTAIALPSRPRGTAFHRFARTPIASDVVFRMLGFPQTVLHRTQGDPSSIQGEVARAYRWPLRRFRDRIAPLALARMVPSGPDHPSLPDMRRGEAWASSFEGPVSLVWGERDPILGRALKRHVERWPEAPVRRTQAGHFLQEEVPEVLAEAIQGMAAALDGRG